MTEAGFQPKYPHSQILQGQRDTHILLSLHDLHDLDAPVCLKHRRVLGTVRNYNPQVYSTYFIHLTKLIKKTHIKLCPHMSSLKTENCMWGPIGRKTAIHFFLGGTWEILQACVCVCWGGGPFDCFTYHKQISASQMSTCTGNQCSLAYTSWSLSCDEGWLFHTPSPAEKSIIYEPISFLYKLKKKVRH